MTTLSRPYVQQALAKRSMFSREFTILLITMASLKPGEHIPAPLTEAYSAMGRASFLDLTLKFSYYQAKQDWESGLASLEKAADKSRFVGFPALYPFSLFYGFLSYVLNFFSILLLFPVNLVYGALDWLGLQAALVYMKNSPGGMDEKIILNRATYVSLATSIFTLPIRIAFGLIEALQEPFHLYDFWVKGGVDAYRERKNHEISFSVYCLKLFLHGFKVVCTMGAILSIVGIAGIPFLSKTFDYLGRIAYGFMDVKEIIPASPYLFDLPVKGLEKALARTEKSFELIGLHFSYGSSYTNPENAVKIGFESAFTKVAELAPKEKGFTPLDINRLT